MILFYFMQIEHYKRNAINVTLDILTFPPLMLYRTSCVDIKS